MDSFITLLKAQSVIIVYILIGMLLSKKGMITYKSRGAFTDFVIKVTLPCMVFSSFMGEMTGDMLKEGASVLFISSGVCIFAWIAGIFIFRKAESRKRSIMKFALLVGNIGFVGMPLVAQVYGEQGSFYGSFYLISNVAFNWSVGIAFLSPGEKGAALVKKVLLNPGIIGVTLGMARMLFNISLPYTAETVIRALGGITSPMGIILVGTILGECRLGDIFDKSVLYTCFCKFIALPLCLMAFLWASGLGVSLAPAAVGVLMVMTAMPAGATTAILAESYGQDEVFASKTVFATTLLSLATAPIAALAQPFLQSIM